MQFVHIKSKQHHWTSTKFSHILSYCRRYIFWLPIVQHILWSQMLLETSVGSHLVTSTQLIMSMMISHAHVMLWAFCDRGTWATGVLILWVITWSCLAVLNSHAQNHFMIYFTPWSQTVRGLWKAGAVNHSESDLGTWAGWLCPQSSLAVLAQNWPFC